jgi:anti-sigma factor RsiW
MLQCSTEDLLLYLYGELPADRSSQIEQLLQQNWDLREKLQVLREARNGVEKTMLTGPRRQTLQLILQQAMETSPVISN